MTPALFSRAPRASRLLTNIVAVGGLMAAVAAGPSAHADVFVETGDAGQTLLTYQTAVTSDGTLDAISGDISQLDDVDLYKIEITDFATFSATTVGTGGTLRDTEIFLFDANGFGIAANDDATTRTGRSTLPAGNPFYANRTPGQYLLAVDSFLNWPKDANGSFILPTSTTFVVQPAFGRGALVDWSTNTGASTGTYTVHLTGAQAISTAAGPSDVPEPGAIASGVIMAGGLLTLIVCGRRPRRRAT